MPQKIKKKRDKKNTKKRVNLSFAEMAAQAQVNVVKPQVEEMHKQLISAILRNTNELNFMKLQLEALKGGVINYTKLTEIEYRDTIWDIEDAELQLTIPKKAVIEKGDKIRVQYEVFNEGKAIQERTFGVLHFLGEAEKEGTRIPVSIQEKMIGMKIGQTNLIQFEQPKPDNVTPIKEGEEAPKPLDIKFEVTVERISKYPKPEKEEVKNEEKV